MDIQFIPYRYSPALVTLLKTWYNDPEMAGFIHPNFSGEAFQPMNDFQVEQMMRPHPNIQRIMVMDGQRPIGEVSITSGFPHLMKTEPVTAWVSILIGDKAYWRKGVATMAMAYLELSCKAQGFHRIELGVFEHNVKAQALYRKMGYHAFARIEDFTYDQGMWHADLRMEKFLDL